MTEGPSEPLAHTTPRIETMIETMEDCDTATRAELIEVLSIYHVDVDDESTEFLREEVYELLIEDFR